MNMQKIPPIQQKRIVSFVNHFIIKTTAFLNHFIQASEASLWNLEDKLKKLEISIILLEAKMNSIPIEVMPHISQEDLRETSEENKKGNGSREADVIVENSEKSYSANESIDMQLIKYRKMLQVGVPLPAVQLKMRQDGLNSNSINKL